MKQEFECNLCGSKTGKTIPFRYAFRDRFLWGVKCDQCELISIWPRPTSEEIQEMYSDDYFVGEDKSTHHMETSYIELLEKGNYSSGVEEIKKYCKSGEILDIGCATGNFIAVLSKHGFKVTGIELSEFASEYGRKKWGINIINKPYNFELLENHIKTNQFDVILMGDVLEHFVNPTEAMKLTYQILKPGGVALIQLPGTLNLLSSKIAFMIYRVIGSQKTMTIPPYHLTEFNTKTAKRMLKECGFSKVIIKQDIKHPNTITLRGNIVENTFKYLMQYVNYILTKAFNVEGDRMIVEAYK
jgi:2-polyprenyl-3-methyl-5-hydroxy-6-metoxy-1,4-benzoquinol methylase